MSYKTILMHVSPDPDLALPFEPAVHLAEDFDAVLIGHGAALPRPSVEIGMTGVLTAALIDDEEGRIAGELSGAAARFRSETAHLNRKAKWRSAVTFPVTALAEAAVLADLIVVRGGLGWVDNNSYRGVSPGDLLMSAGRPVLVVRPECTRVTARNIVVAWKNTQEARRALSDSLPFLKRAEAVTVVHMVETGEKNLSTAGDAIEYLKAHGIEAREQTLQKSGPVVDQIFDLAWRSQADLIVSGGYGHSRAREWAFGGVTRGLLDRCQIPMLLSH